MTEEEVIGRLAMGSKEIESVLETKFGARGTGLHSKAESVEAHLGAGLMARIHYVATIRNKAMHDGAFHEVPFVAWTRAKDQILAALEAIAPPDPNPVASAPAVRHASPQGLHIGQILGGGFVLVAFSCLGLAILFNHQSNQRASEGARSSEAPTVPPWSPDNPGHAKQAFAWREEQAAFVASGEEGALPPETLWEVTSGARPVTRKGIPVLEMSIQLGGGKTTGKIFFATRDSFGLKTSGYGFDAELATKKRVLGRVQGVAFQKNGHMFSIGLNNHENPFDCKREVPKGCGEWKDNGVAYVALSTASLGNAFKLLDAPK